MSWCQVYNVLLQLSRVGGARRSPVSRSGDGAGGPEEKDCVEGGQETNGENTHTHTQVLLISKHTTSC